MRDGRLGLIDTPGQRKTTQTDLAHDAGTPWCADNGAFSDNFDEDKWWKFLVRNAHRADTCIFAVAPDVVGDALATHERSEPWLRKIRELGYPVAYVAQDGFDPSVVPWDEIDWLFIGGTTAFKRSERGGYSAIAEGRRHGKRVHVGRVNGGAFLRNVAAAGAETADGTKLCFGPDQNYGLVVSWLDGLTAYPPMPMEALL